MIGIIGDWTASIRDDIRMILQLVINPTNSVNLSNSINWSIL